MVQKFKCKAEFFFIKIIVATGYDVQFFVFLKVKNITCKHTVQIVMNIYNTRVYEWVRTGKISNLILILHRAITYEYITSSTYLQYIHLKTK